VVPAGAAQSEVEVEPWVLLAGVGDEVGGSPILLLTLVLMLLRLVRWVGGVVVVHCSVLQGSTFGQSCHNLPLLGFLVSMVLSAMRSCRLVERPIM
jgi:hypothetical protein